MNESIIVGLVVGGGVAVIAAYFGHLLRLREIRIQADEERKRMKALSAEEERRRKSDRRRELCEGDLKIVSETVQALTETMARAIEAITSSRAEELRLGKGLIVESHRMMLKCIVVVHSFEDPELTERFKETMDAFGAWWNLFLDWEAGRVKEGVEEKSSERAVVTQMAASNTVRRIRQILEEV